ncbi:hypothetical protein [Pseudomonas sp. SJZ079]|uniref:hypothetical protein n=1 Tax=Pseudomonas sp. SJZ079 TaxID=2572887 RepID=UPI0011BDD6F8|nr:hypothetical protein [Pseudomonas sp. SJZ079]
MYPLIESGELFTQPSRLNVPPHPGFLYEQMACTSIGLVAPTEAHAHAWLQRILADCESVVATTPYCLQSLTLHAFGWEDAIPEGMHFHETHVVEADQLTHERLAHWQSRSDLLSLHFSGNRPSLGDPNPKCFFWPDGRESTTRFLANLLIALDQRELIKLDWATYASLFPGGRRCWANHSKGGLPVAVLGYPGSASTQGSPKPIRSAFMLIDYGDTFSLGEYATACDQLTSRLTTEGHIYVALRYAPACDTSRYWLLLSDDLDSKELS